MDKNDIYKIIFLIMFVIFLIMFGTLLSLLVDANHNIEKIYDTLFKIWREGIIVVNL